MMLAGHQHYYCSVGGGSSTHELHQVAVLSASSKSFRARRGPTGHAACCQGAVGMSGQGALTGPCGVVTNPDDALAGAQWITIRSFQAVRSREASEFSPASVPLRYNLR
jgi:hypothetical protein